jgi:hypothetical protein
MGVTTSMACVSAYRGSQLSGFGELQPGGSEAADDWSKATLPVTEPDDRS